jgi:hypothetical protein
MTLDHRNPDFDSLSNGSHQAASKICIKKSVQIKLVGQNPPMLTQTKISKAADSLI